MSHKRIVETLERAPPTPTLSKLSYSPITHSKGELWEKAVRCSRQAGNHRGLPSCPPRSGGAFRASAQGSRASADSREQTELAIDNPLRPTEFPPTLWAILNGFSTTFERWRRRPLCLGTGPARHASSFACQYYRLMGDLSPAVEAGERAMAIADKMSDPQLGIVARSRLGPALAARGDHRRATGDPHCGCGAPPGGPDP